MKKIPKNKILKAIKLANNEITEWKKFKKHCSLLLKS